MSAYREWIGRRQTRTDFFDPERCNALDIALGGAGGMQAGDVMPNLFHWIHFWDVQPPTCLGTDGHPAKGDFLPPVPLARRMWAGGRIIFHRPMRLGSRVERISTVTSITEKVGRTGTLFFVTLRHELVNDDGLALTEEQDLVYRDAASQPVGAPAPASGPPPVVPWLDTINPDRILLFRYSALTMNGHRIHYDRDYARNVEGYPDLVVHGPLQATMMLRLAQRHLDQPITGFDFRGQSPAFSDIPLHICGRDTSSGAEIWTQQGESKNMVATVQIA